MLTMKALHAEFARTEAIRIVRPTVFRGFHVEPPSEFHDCTGPEAMVMCGASKAVRIPRMVSIPAAGREMASAEPVVEIPEHRATTTGSAALAAEASTRRRKSPKSS
jgi:hypothetical protein